MDAEWPAEAEWLLDAKCLADAEKKLQHSCYLFGVFSARDDEVTLKDF